MRYLAEVEARVARGLVGVPEATAPERQGKALTLVALAERFYKEANPPTKNPECYRSWLRYMLGKHVLPDLAMLPIASLKPGQVEALRDRKLAEGYKPATVNSMLKAVSVLYIWARKQGLHEGVNPTSGMRKSSPAGLVDYLSSDEVAQLLGYTREAEVAIAPTKEA